MKKNKHKIKTTIAHYFNETATDYLKFIILVLMSIIVAILIDKLKLYSVSEFIVNTLIVMEYLLLITHYFKLINNILRY